MKFFLFLIFSFFLVMPLLTVSPVVSSAAPILPPQPAFWKTKEKVYKKIREERAIIVSVNVIEDAQTDVKKPKILQMTGGGHIGVPQKFAYDQARNFSNLKKVSSHIREANYNANDQTLYLHTEAFNYHAKMKLKLDFKETETENQLRFTVIEGLFLGMQGQVIFSEIEPLKSEIGFFAGYRYKDLPMPQFFVKFGLEVVIQKISGLLRSYIENEFSRAKRQSHEVKK